ncbi:MAG: biopolymer transporter ExbD [Proteobacteria bacterium]|jgi:biopolymer transport protein ExbD|nr:biopolymer transporter ExbD [Pseudomonadota bacterium]
MRMRRYRNEEHESQHGIDLAPMLDFVLNLLIFFIITAIFVKEYGLEVNRPSSFEQSSSDNSSITVNVFANGDIAVNGRLVDLRAIRANIERVHAEFPNSGVLLLADEGAKNGLIIEAADQVRLGGIQDITFSTSQ